MFDSEEGFLNGISSPTKFSIQEINVCTAQGEKKYPKDYFQINISHQKDFFKEFNLIFFISYQKGCKHHSIVVQYGTINFLFFNIYWPDGKPQFLDES